MQHNEQQMPVMTKFMYVIEETEQGLAHRQCPRLKQPQRLGLELYRVRRPAHFYATYLDWFVVSEYSLQKWMLLDKPTRIYVFETCISIH